MSRTRPSNASRQLIQARPSGLTIIVDELAGLFSNMGRYSNGVIGNSGLMLGMAIRTELSGWTARRLILIIYWSGMIGGLSARQGHPGVRWRRRWFLCAHDVLRGRQRPTIGR